MPRRRSRRSLSFDTPERFSGAKSAGAGGSGSDGDEAATNASATASRSAVGLIGAASVTVVEPVAICPCLRGSDPTPGQDLARAALVGELGEDAKAPAQPPRS